MPAYWASNGNVLLLERPKKCVKLTVLCPKWLRKMIERNSKGMADSFRKTSSLKVQSGRGRKSVSQDSIEDVVTAIIDRAQDNIAGISSAGGVARNLYTVLYDMKHFTKNYLFPSTKSSSGSSERGGVPIGYSSTSPAQICTRSGDMARNGRPGNLDFALEYECNPGAKTRNHSVL